MRDTPETLPYGTYLPDVYRFAFLMTGRADTAADVLRHTVGRATRGGLNGIRDLLQAKRWLFAEARTLCAHPPPPAPRDEATPSALPGNADGDATLPPVPVVEVPALPSDDPPHRLALLFADLPEDERCALILFYLFLFDPAELAELLEIKATELGPLLLRGRTSLQHHGVRYENLFAVPPVDESDTADVPPAVSAPETPADHAMHDAA